MHLSFSFNFVEETAIIITLHDSQDVWTLNWHLLCSMLFDSVL